MNTKEMLDKAEKIIARQDVDRALLLFFMNTARKAVIRNFYIPKFVQYLTGVPFANGIVDTASLNLKAVQVVEYDDGTNKFPLKKLRNYAEARERYPDFSQKGTPEDYLELGTKIYILPVPDKGTINLLAEVWPADLTDDVMSSDITTVEIPEALIYFAVAEYFDYFDEADRGSYWRRKGSVILQQYVTEQNNNALVDDGVSGYF